MKYALIVLTLAVAISCRDKKPSDPVLPSPTPVVVETPPPVVTPVKEMGVFCPGGDFSPACPTNPNLDVNRSCVIGEPVQCSSGVRYECKKAC